MLMPEYLRDLHKAGLKRYQETGHRHIELAKHRVDWPSQKWRRISR